MKLEQLPLELKFADGDESSPGTMLQGYGSVFGKVDQHADIIDPGAFEENISEIRQGKAIFPKMLYQHNASEVIGIWTELSTDQKGLRVTGNLVKGLPRYQELDTLVRNKMIDGLSIGFRTLRADNDANGARVIKAAEIWEVSLVTFPANKDALLTDVKQLRSVREVETLLRAQGVPAKFAKLVAKYGFDGAQDRLADTRDELQDEAKIDQGSLKGLVESLKNLKKELDDAQR